MKLKKFLATALATIAAFATLGFTACKEPAGDSLVVKAIEVKLTDEEYAFVTDKENTQLIADFNAFLAEIQDNGDFAKYVAKYFEGTGTKNGYDVTTTDVVNTADKFVVVTNCPFEPFEYIGNDGKIYGLDIEIAAAYAQKKNLTLVIKNIGFDDIFTQVDAGYADIGMAGITVSPDREDLYGFTSKYYTASQKLIVAADNTDFDNCTTLEEVEAKIKSLTGKKFGYQTGTTGSMYVKGDADWGYDGFANLEGKGYPTAQDAVNDLINGNIYAVVVDEAPANAIVKAVNGK